MNFRFCILIITIIITNLFGTAKTTIVFRIDDFLFHNNSKQENIINTFEKYTIPLSVAWIPYEWQSGVADCMEDSLWVVYAERFNNGVIEILQHGCYHHNFKPDCNPYMEFQGLTTDEQSTLIKRGKTALDSCLISNHVKTKALPAGFVFPCNVYDHESLNLLIHNGFRLISSNLSSPINHDILSYPCTTEDFFELESIINNNELEDGIIIVLFHNYTINDTFTFDRLDSLLSKIRSNDEVECITLRELANRNAQSYNGAFVAKHPICYALFKYEKVYLNKVSNLSTSALHGLVYAFSFLIPFLIIGIIFKLKKTIQAHLSHFRLYLLGIWLSGLFLCTDTLNYMALRNVHCSYYSKSCLQTVG